MSSKVRHRPSLPDRSSRVDHDSSSDSTLTSSKESRSRPKHGRVYSRGISETVWLFSFSFFAVVFLYVHCANNHFPSPVSVDESRPGQFVEERARKLLRGLTSFGSRPVGSHANEELAVDYILGAVENIRLGMNASVHRLDVDVQRVTGSFDLEFLGHFTSYYENVNNIIVRLGPVKGADHSLLINCHYDTVMNTTGASDDTVSCCIMLEVLRVMSTRNTPHQHGVIFIFNGAEENILQASHGFITQHPWAKEIRAFVNLEAAGAGGREILFQSGYQLKK